MSEGRFEVVGTRGRRAAVIFDIDGDGDQDLVTSEFHDRPRVLVSDLSARATVRYLKMRLRGTASNRDGLGAEIRVRAGSKTYSRHHDGKLGYISQSSYPIYFGLGKSDSVDSVTVIWPSGTVQTVTEGIWLNTLLELKQPPKAAP